MMLAARSNPLSRTHIPALDGIRGLAIVAVLLFHLHVPGMSLGWAGVPLFFVLSGFLITGILLDTKDRPFYFKTFFVRRGLRIFPVYYLVLSIVTLMALAAMVFAARPESLHELPMFAAYLQNYGLGVHGVQTLYDRYLSHTWSLAIEEQFYLLWPFAVYFLPRKLLTICCLSMISLAMASRYYLLGHLSFPYLFYMALPSQLDSLAIGALLAILVRSPLAHAQLRKAGLIALLIGVAATAILIAHTGMEQYWEPTLWEHVPGMFAIYTFLGIMFGATILLSVLGNKICQTVFEWSPLRYIGKISYGLYLYHPLVFMTIQHLFKWARIQDGGMAHVALVLTEGTVSVTIAVLSYRFFETKVLAYKDRIRFSDSSNNGRAIKAEPPI